MSTAIQERPSTPDELAVYERQIEEAEKSAQQYENQSSHRISRLQNIVATISVLKGVPRHPQSSTHEKICTVLLVCSFQYLRPPQIIKCAAVCRSWKLATESPVIWKFFLQKESPQIYQHLIGLGKKGAHWDAVARPLVANGSAYRKNFRENQTASWDASYAKLGILFEVAFLPLFLA